MHITFDTSNPQDLTILNKLLAHLDGPVAQPEVVNTGTAASESSSFTAEGSGVSGEAAPPTASPAPEKKRARKAKEAAAELQNETAEPAEPAAEPAPAAEPTAYTLDQVRAALQQFTADKGVPAGIELLKNFGAGRISELGEEHYAAFVAECAK